MEASPMRLDRMECVESTSSSKDSLISLKYVMERGT